MFSSPAPGCYDPLWKWYSKVFITGGLKSEQYLQDDIDQHRDEGIDEVEYHPDFYRSYVHTTLKTNYSKFYFSDAFFNFVGCIKYKKKFDPAQDRIGDYLRVKQMW